ncbi:hypothetical protein Aca07nite_21010 [Actinoplanes capillaceus]|uniref:Uncharacterized protein n=1 Tax=Actinoplanes campanulatus TaxID=113559 RepID=A0ABQ3WFF7_9ACTN|nr:hypothetical protein Aca07nite_21010 [Actinoplanes capillaceus]
MTALRPGQSPPPVSTPIRIILPPGSGSEVRIARRGPRDDFVGSVAGPGRARNRTLVAVPDRGERAPQKPDCFRADRHDRAQRRGIAAESCGNETAMGSHDQ